MSSANLAARVAALLAATQPAAPPADPVVLTSVLNTQLARTLARSANLGDVLDVKQAQANLGVSVIFDSVATLRTANVASYVDSVILTGYYPGTQLGGGTLVRDKTDTTTVDDGGSCFVVGATRWKRVFTAGMIGLADFGLSSAPTVDNQPCVLAAINYAKGRNLFAHEGFFNFNSGIQTTLPINIQGCGNGSGPGGAEQYTDKATIFVCNFANPTLFKVTSTRPSRFEGFQIDVQPNFRPAGNGAGIELDAPRVTNTETQANSIIRGVAFNNLFYGIHLFANAYPKIENCYFGEWTDSAILSETDSYTEASTGFIYGCYFFGRTGSAQRACIWLRNGYTVMAHNEILGAQFGILIDIANYPAGFIQAHDNTIEENYYNGICFRKTGSDPVVASSMANFHNNEFSSIITANTYTGSIYIDENNGVPWLDDVKVNCNTTRHLLPAGARHLFINGGRTMSISGNICEELSANNVIGIQVTGVVKNTALVGPILVADNLFRKIQTRYAFANTGVITVRDPIPDTTANIFLWGPCADGSTAYASDGRSSDARAATLNLLLTNGGTGSPAVHVRGSWLTPIPLS